MKTMQVLFDWCLLNIIFLANPDEPSEICEVKIWDQPWKKLRSVTHKTCKTIENGIQNHLANLNGNDQQVLGGDGHDQLPHGHILGGDGHDQVQHRRVLGGDGHDQLPHGHLLGGDGHDQAPHRHVLGGDGHDQVPHGHILGGDGHDQVPLVANFIVTFKKKSKFYISILSNFLHFKISTDC